MSYVHYNEFDRIRREHDEVVAVLSFVAMKSRKAKPSQKNRFVGIPFVDSTRLESAIATANDAYALLLIATAEGFMRTYLISASIPIGAEPKLSALIDKCRKEFNNINKTNHKIQISNDDANDVLDV